MRSLRYMGSVCITTVFVAGSLANTSYAQQEATGAAATQKGGELEEVIVTARKREESILDVPVIETAVPQAKLESLQVVEMTDLANIVPGLDFGRNLLSIGTQVSLRGIGSSSYDQGVDSSVALYVDGIAPGTGLAFESGFFDLAQVEVLKGPQALFYGKSTTGGVISLRSADPTDEFEVSARTAYDFEALTNRQEAIISGPVTSTLKLRLAAMYQNSEGYFYERAVATPGLGGVTPGDSRTPRSRNYQIRGTLLWNPSDQFDARLKVNLVHDRVIEQEASQYVDCPQGPDFSPAGVNFLGHCGISRNNYVVWLSPTAFPGVIDNGVPDTDHQQQFGILELNYRPTERLTLTSLTTDYVITSSDLVNAIETDGAATPIAAENHFRRTETTEELRLNSDFAGPLNFTAGGYFENGLITENVLLLGNTALKLPALLVNGYNQVHIRTYSPFGQLRYQIVKGLELAAGVRWTHEKRSENPLNELKGGQPVPVTTPVVKSINTSPEVTLTYHLTDDLTSFAAFKKAYKSGSIKLSTPPNPGDNNAFNEEKAQGGEAGIKSRWLDRRLALNVAAYRYNYSGLQVGGISPAVNGVPVIQTVNAGAARSYGVDLDAAYNPPVLTGLGLNAAVNWNHARYIVLDNVPCWGGQTIALGCSNLLNPATGLYTAQNLNGTPLLRAPNWQGNFGFTYTLDLPARYQLVFTNNNTVSSRYVTALAVGRPNNDNYQGGFVKADLGLSLNGPRDSWQLAVIVKNVTDKLTYGTTGLSDFGAGVGLGRDGVTQFEGGTVSGRDGIDQANAFVEPGREFWLRLTVKPFGGHE